MKGPVPMGWLLKKSGSRPKVLRKSAYSLETITAKSEERILRNDGSGRCSLKTTVLRSGAVTDFRRSVMPDCCGKRSSSWSFR